MFRKIKFAILKEINIPWTTLFFNQKTPTRTGYKKNGLFPTPENEKQASFAHPQHPGPACSWVMLLGGAYSVIMPNKPVENG
jgi:hypothetical protein